MLPFQALRMRNPSSVAVADFGALVAAATGQGFTTTAYDVVWDSELYDYSGWHSNVTNNTRLTVISGVSMVRVISNTRCGDADLVEHQKNGATFRGMGRADTEGFPNIVSAPLAVTAGDYFTTNVTHSSALNTLVGGSEPTTWMAIEILPASLKYALVYKSGNQSLAASTNTALTFDSEVADTDGFHDNVTNNTRLSVPVGGPTLVRLSGQARGQDATAGAQFVLNINKNGATARGLPFKDTDTAGNDHVNIISAPIVVTPGTDYFELVAFGTNATTVSAINDVWFAIEEVPSTWKRALVNKSSGTQSFTGGTTTAVTWDAEVYDTDGLHDNVTNNTRLTVPSGCTRARPCFSLKTSSVASTHVAVVRKNGSNYQGQPAYNTDTAGTDNLSAMGAWVDVVPGDYFEVFFNPTTTCTLGTENETWFCLECQ